jgi:hypothetical protein
MQYLPLHLHTTTCRTFNLTIFFSKHSSGKTSYSDRDHVRDDKSETLLSTFDVFLRQPGGLVRLALLYAVIACGHASIEHGLACYLTGR